MNTIGKRAGAAVLATAMLASMAQAAEITPSTVKVELDENQNTFTVDIHVNEEEKFAGMEFGIDLPDGVELTGVEYLDSAIKGASHTPVVTREEENRTYFGFYLGENAFQGEYDVATLTFRYSGDADVEIVLGYSNVVSLESNGETASDETSNSFTIEVTREENQGGGSGGGGSNTGGNNGGQTDIGEGDTPLGSAPFTDVADDAWYKEAVDYVYANGLMSGTSATTFAPNMLLSRAMIAQVVHNLEDNPAAAEQGVFTDVAAGAWYADAVDWAAGEGIVSGYGNGKFGPEDNITREQMALILYGYAQYKGYDVSASGELSSFTDGASTSGWAAEAVRWAVGSGLLSGKGGGVLDPQGTATRAEVASILMRFAQKNG